MLIVFDFIRFEWKVLFMRFYRAGIFWGLLFFTCGSGYAFSLKDTEGKIHQLAELKNKWVVVNFWATWCAPCIKEIPDIASFAKEQGSQVHVIGIAQDWDDAKQVSAFAKKVGLTYPLVLGDEGSEKTFGKMKGLPTTFIYDPSGKLVYQKTGTVTKQLLEKIIKEGKAPK